jgi:hypothetical protein
MYNYEDDEDVEKTTAEWSEKLTGKSFTFEDGDNIEVIQVKRREKGPWVTFHIKQGPGIPRKLVLGLDEFLKSYGHLFVK